MRAAVIDALGPAESIHMASLPVPEPAAGEVRVRVTATTVNHVDTFVRSGAYRTPMTFPFVVGRDLVGTVDAVGDDVSAFRVGESVWCNSLGHGGRQGAAAEFAIVPQDRLYRVPDGVDPIELVALVHPAATAWLALVRHGGLETGGTAFVGGGGGNVGSCAVAIARSLGARVVTSAGARDVARLRSLGVEALDYRDPDLDEALAKALAPAERARPGEASVVAPSDGADVWLDTSGTFRLAQAVPLLAQGGRIVLIAGMTRHDEFTFGDLYTHDRSITGFAISNASVDDLARAATVINGLVVSRAVPALPIDRLPLSAASAVHAELDAGTRRRRAVLLPSLDGVKTAVAAAPADTAGSNDSSGS